MTDVLGRKRKFDTNTHVQKEDHVKTQREKMAIYKPKREALEEINPTDTLVWGFSSPELLPEILLCGITVAQAN